MTSLEKLKQHLNSLYGKSAYEMKQPMYIDNRVKNDLMEDFKMSNNMNVVDAFTHTIQQDIYRSLTSTPSMTFKINTSEKSDIPNEAEEKWTWVTGYKGLDKDMKAYGDFQYEMDQLYIMPEGEPVKACHGGFHLCLNLEDLYGYKPIEDGNRFFECSALVRDSDLENYGKCDPCNYYGLVLGGGKVDKLAAKSIRLIRELTVDEILAHIEGAKEWPEHVKEMAITKNITAAKTEMKILDMVRIGYAKPLAEYIVNDRNGKDGYKLAMALDAQPGISMDTKINAIFSHI